MILHFLLFYPIKRLPAKTNLSKLYYFHHDSIRKVSFWFLLLCFHCSEISRGDCSQAWPEDRSVVEKSWIKDATISSKVIKNTDKIVIDSFAVRDNREAYPHINFKIVINL